MLIILWKTWNVIMLLIMVALSLAGLVFLRTLVLAALA